MRVLLADGDVAGGDVVERPLRQVEIHQRVPLGGVDDGGVDLVAVGDDHADRHAGGHRDLGQLGDLAGRPPG